MKRDVGCVNAMKEVANLIICAQGMGKNWLSTIWVYSVELLSVVFLLRLMWKESEWILLSNSITGWFAGLSESYTNCV